MSKHNRVPSDYVSIREIAEKGLLPMGYDYLVRACRDGTIPHYRFSNRYYMSREQIAEVIRSSEHTPATSE